MIGSLRGQLIDRLDSEVTIEVAGIGYRITVSPATAVALGELGDDSFVYVHHHFREDDQTLYGFTTRQERSCFEVLISAHGVGPSLALAILAVHDPAGLARVLATEDLAGLCLVPGVGNKTAQRLLVELKEKLPVPDVDLTTTSTPLNRDAVNGLTDVRQALSGLGYSTDEVQAALRDLPTDVDASVLLKAALQQLAVRS